MDWILSFASLLVLWLMGNKSKYGPIVGLFTQGLWFTYVISTNQTGLLIGVIAYTVVHARNTYLWLKEEENG